MVDQRGIVAALLHKRNLARFGLHTAKRDKWRGKWTPAESSWGQGITKYLGNEGGILNV